MVHAKILKPYFKKLVAEGSYIRHCYYKIHSISQGDLEKRLASGRVKLGHGLDSQKFYHGEDFCFKNEQPYNLNRDLKFLIEAIYHYDVFHFSNVDGISFGGASSSWIELRYGKSADIHLLRSLGKIVVYTNNGCLDEHHRVLLRLGRTVSLRYLLGVIRKRFVVMQKTLNGANFVIK